MTTQSAWPDAYPPSRLRAETRAMAEAWAEVLVELLPPAALRAVHFKGSALKAWDSPIDYVPGLSDVDIHVTLATEADVARLDDLDSALRVNHAVLGAYRRRVPAPLHVPKPQLVIANQLERDASILPSPAATVETLWGEAYREYALTEDEQAAQRARDRDELRHPAHLEFTKALPLRAIDRIGDRIVPLLGELNWRVSPVAPRVLEVAGVSYAEAWSLNRTRLVAALRERALVTLADCYQAYYLAGWRLFLEGAQGEAAGDVLRAGVEVVRLGARFAEGAR